MPRLSDTLPLPDQNDTVVLDDDALFGVKPLRKVQRSARSPLSRSTGGAAVIDVWQVRLGLILAVVATADLGLGSLFGTLTPGNASLAIEAVLVAIVFTGWGLFRWRDVYLLPRRG